MSDRITLLGLQIGERITICSNGIIWRDSEHPDRSHLTDPHRRLQGATALEINTPEGVHYLAMFLGEILQAAGQPFALCFEYAWVNEVDPAYEAIRLFVALQKVSDYHRDGFKHGDDEEEPAYPDFDAWDSSAYYEAHFEIVRAPQG